MAVQIQFEGQGDGLLEGIRQAIDAIVRLKAVVADTNESQLKGAQQAVAAQEQYVTSVEAAVSATTQLNKQSTAGGAAKLATDLDKAATSAETLDSALTEAERTTFTTVIAGAKEVARQEGIIVKELSKEKTARIDALVAARQMTAEEGKLAKEAAQVVDAFADAPLVIETGAKSVLSLRAQLKAARDEATSLITEFGEFSPQAVAATQRVAELDDKMADFNQRVKSLNPDSGSLGAFAKFGSVLTNGAQAVGGFFAAFGAGGGQIQEAALKLQSFVLGVQGAKEFFAGFNDALKDLRIALGLTTTAQKASTVASQVDTVTKEAQIVATTGVGTASAGAVTGIRAFFAAFLSSPLGPFLLVLGAVGLAFAFFSKQTEEARKSYQEFIDTINNRKARVDLEGELKRAQLQKQFAIEEAQRQKEVEDGRRKSSERTIAELERDAEREKAINEKSIEATKQLDDEREKGFKALQELKRQAVTTDDQDRFVDIQDEERFSDLRKALQLEETATNQEVIDAYYAAKRRFRQDDLTSQAEALNAEAEFIQQANEIRDEQLQKERQAIEDRKRLREQLVADLLAIEKTLAEKVFAAEVDAADPEAKLELQRKAGEDEINLLRQNLLRKQALLELEKRIGVAAFQELSEAQKQARADALIEDGTVQLATEQQKQFQELSLENWRVYYQSISELAAQNNRTRLDLLTDDREREQKEFELGLNQQAEALKKAGATEIQVLEFRRIKTSEFTEKRVEESRSIEEQIAIAQVEAIKAGGDQSAEAQRAAELQILQIKLDAAQVSLSILGDAQDEETRLRRAQLEKTIAELQGAIRQKAAERTPIDIFTLLGISFNNEEQKQAVSDAVNNVIGLVEASIAAQRAEVDAQISATDELIADRERRSESLQQQLEQEIELAKLGLANNVDAVRQQIAENDKAAAADKARKARLIEEQKKFARQQLAIDAAQQASALITTGANLLASESLKGIVGVIAGIGFFASILAAFTAFKARAAAINNGGSSFKKGGTLEGLVEGSAHGSRYGEGGIAMFDRRTGKEVGEIEGREFIINSEAAARHTDILKAVNRNDISRVAELAVRELAHSQGIHIESERVKEFVELKTSYVTSTTVVQKEENKALLERVDALTKVVKGFRNEQKPDAVKIIPTGTDGSRIEKSKGVTKVIRRVKKH